MAWSRSATLQQKDSTMSLVTVLHCRLMWDPLCVL